MRRKLVPLAFVAVVIAGCGGTSEVAKDRAAQGAPCEAAELEPSSSKFAAECTSQKNREASEKEAKHEDEAIREGERLKEEGK
ncbi:MAG: hypothetical protein ACLP1Q_18700 [Solirubrobacteraceae bacterium]